MAILSNGQEKLNRIVQTFSALGNEQHREPIIVFPGSFWNGSTEHALSAGFRKLGWHVQEIDQRDYFGQGGSLLERVVSRALSARNIDSYEEAIIETCQHLKPDILFTVKGSYLSSRTKEVLESVGSKFICFYPDLHFDFPNLDLELIFSADLFITSKKFHLPWLNERRMAGEIVFVSHGYHPYAHCPILKQVSESDYSADVRYIGNHSADKEVWLQALASLLPEVNLKISGHRWVGRLPAAMLEATELRAISYALATQTARINVAVHSGKAANDWEDLVSTRTFEIPACGGFMLHIDNMEVREYFEVGHEIDVFSTQEELVDKCRFYLKRPDLRKKMRERAFERCVPKYSYFNRALSMQERFETLFGKITSKQKS